MKIYDPSTSIGEFLAATAARQPTPGGGSVAALAGALAAAIGEMVLNYSVGKKGLEASDARHREVVAELGRARRMLLQLMSEDQLAFDAMTCVRKLAPDSPERAAKHDAALLACIRVPEAMAATGVAILELCTGVVDTVNRYLLSDLAVCAELAMATVRCGLYNVRVNIKEVANASDRAGIEQTVARLLARATPLIQQLIPRVWQRDAATP